MHDLRNELKESLVDRDKYCPLCGKARPDAMHEVICPPMGGNKYDPENEALAALVYVEENCVLLHNYPCNVVWANSRKEALLRYLMQKCGIEKVVLALRRLATKLKVPSALIPASIDFEDKIIRILGE